MFYKNSLTHSLQIKILAVAVLIGWIGLGLFYVPAGWYLATVPATIASVAGLVMVLICNGGRVTAMLGKIAIFVAVLQLFVVYIGSLSITIDTAEWWLLYAIVSGLVLERVSPHQQFYPWMFLGIATKVQFGLVSGALKELSATSSLFPEVLWWASVGLLALAVPLAATTRRRFYRIVVLMSSLVSVVLLIDLVSRFVDLSTVGIVLALAVILWPLFIDRWVGRKIFT